MHCVIGAEFEKQPFLPTEPVRLTPAWEETNLPNDELNFKEVTMENAQLEMNPPFDRFVWFLETKYETWLLNNFSGRLVEKRRCTFTPLKV